MLFRFKEYIIGGRKIRTSGRRGKRRGATAFIFSLAGMFA
jgi:hypothetical protein